MRVRYTLRARTDLDTIYTHTVRESPDGGLRVKASIQKTVRNLGRLPHVGRETNKRDVRIIGVTRYPYLVFYCIKEDEVHVVHIRHTSREPF